MKLQQKTREPDRTEEFWMQVENAHGKILAYGLAQYSSVDIDSEQMSVLSQKSPLTQWGLCYCTEHILFFHHFPQNNVFSNILGRKESTEYCMGIPFSDIQSWRIIVPNRKGFLNKLKKQERKLVITGTAYRYNLHDNAIISVSESSNASALLQNSLEKARHHLFGLDFQEKDIRCVLQSIVGEKAIPDES